MLAQFKMKRSLPERQLTSQGKSPGQRWGKVIDGSSEWPNTAHTLFISRFTFRFHKSVVDGITIFKISPNIIQFLCQPSNAEQIKLFHKM